MTEPEDEQEHRDPPEVGLPLREALSVGIRKLSCVHTLLETIRRPCDCSDCCRKRNKSAGVHHSDSAVLALQNDQAPTPWICKFAGMQDGFCDNLEEVLTRRGPEGSELSRCGTPQQQQGKHLAAAALLLSGGHFRNYAASIG